MAESLDFQINDLKFRAAISDKFPYARATAPFRKEQFDAAPTVGDQSLAGWWTRGQLSFHKGGGVKYYEVLSGDEVLNRYLTSETIEPFTPGRLGLAAESSDYLTADAFGDEIPSITSSGFERLAWVEDVGGAYTVKRKVGGTTATITTTGDVIEVVAGANNYFGHTGSTGGIERFPTSGSTTATQIYTHSTGILAMWYAKDRLWFVDYDTTLYAVAPNPSGALPVAVGSTSEVFTFGDGAGGTWTLAETPGPVLVGTGSSIYRVTIDADGSVPTLSAAISVANFGRAERVVGMRFLLGVLVIGTTKGLRCAEVQSDGSLVIGPLLLTGETISNQLAAHGSMVHGVLGRTKHDATTVRLVRVDVSQAITPLVFAYDTTDLGYIPIYTEVAADDTGVHVAGGIATGGGFIRTFPETTALTDLSPTGSVTTGLHRFGTLDLKHFQSVVVRYEGDGEIDVHLVDADGTVGAVPLETVAVSGAGQTTIPLGLTEPVESIGLKFVLRRSSTTPTEGPALLGYQIKALPSPKRQRLIQWPVVATDAVRDRYGVERGRRGSAWEAWEALESLEENDALVTYTDHRTGETGEAFIESIELQSDTPSQGAMSGFGGIGMITLRKVS